MRGIMVLSTSKKRNNIGVGQNCGRWCNSTGSSADTTLTNDFFTGQNLQNLPPFKSYMNASINV